VNDSMHALVAGELDKLRNVQSTLHLADTDPDSSVELPGEVHRLTIRDFANDESSRGFDLIFISLSSPLRDVDQLILAPQVVRALNPKGVVMQITSGEGTTHLSLALIMMKYAVSFETNDYELRILGNS
jgi:hypothetical protein